jgi:uncharacterized protein YdhG (YjbR/CyaY superfamily)
MPKRKPAPQSAPKRGKPVFTAEERAAMREHVRSMRAPTGDGETEVREKIAAMAPADRAMGERVHAIVKSVAPQLVPRLWYGMPAWSNDAGVVCFFQDAAKFKARYATLGFSDRASLDEGNMWPSSFALTKVGAAEESRIAELIRKATSGGSR